MTTSSGQGPGAARQFVPQAAGGRSPAPAYEARVLHGIWATAPYLHNGSVPSLWELLKPAKERKPTFKVGSRVFDPKNVGYDTEQSPFPNGPSSPIRITPMATATAATNTAPTSARTIAGRSSST